MRPPMGWVLLAVATAVTQPGCETTRATSEPSPAPIAETAEVLLMAGPGRIETQDDPLDVGVAASGVLLHLPVRQNDVVGAGQLLARLDCRDLEAEAAQYESEKQALLRTRERLLVGGRPEDRAAAAARADAAQARLRERRAWLDRIQELARRQSVSLSELQAERDYSVAEAESRVAAELRLAAAAAPLPEDLAQIDAQVRAAESRLAAARARLAKCTVRAPIGGTVLRTHAGEGEFLSAANPKPLLTLADLSRLRVRAEVDEKDIGRIRDARRVSVTSDAWPGRAVPARLDYQAPLMGRRRTRTGDPAEKSDRDVLEVLIELEDPAPDWPLGLRVTVQFWE